MNFRVRDGETIVLMSIRPGAPYADRIEEEGRVLIYEGHDVAKTKDGPSPKRADQLARTPGGSLTQNGLFAQAAQLYKDGEAEAERVSVFQKIRSGIWAYSGLFELVDYWTERSDARMVYKFKLRLMEANDRRRRSADESMRHDRLIPSWVKLAVWKRDRGRCGKCGAGSGLHFDHIIPYSKGGSSKVPENIQILCGRHNLAKHDNIE